MHGPWTHTPMLRRLGLGGGRGLYGEGRRQGRWGTSAVVLTMKKVDLKYKLLHKNVEKMIIYIN